MVGLPGGSGLRRDQALTSPSIPGLCAPPRQPGALVQVSLCFGSFLRGLTPPALPLALVREPQTPGGGAEGTDEGLTMQHQAGDEGEPPEPTQEAQEEGAPVGSSSAFSEEEEEEEEDTSASTQEGPLPSAQSADRGGGGAAGGGGDEGPATNPSSTSSSPSPITCCPPSGLLLGLTVLLLSLLGSWAVVHLTLGTRGGAPFRISTSYDWPVSRDAPATIEPRFTTNCTVADRTFKDDNRDGAKKKKNPTVCPAPVLFGLVASPCFALPGQGEENPNPCQQTLASPPVDI
ncbi:unnamed protein product [Arctogadus glacialis]